MRAPHSEVPTPMFRLLRKLAATALLGLAFTAPAQATPYSTDYSDLWWVGPAEDGWGVNFIQQGDVIFATFFVYGNDRSARWFVAPAMAPTGTQPSVGHRFSGDLYQTTGPWFGGPFDPAQVGGNVVGTAMVTFDSPDTATLTYTVSGTPVVKAITRQTFRSNSVAGFYYGGLVAIASQCRAASDNGAVDIVGSVTATHTVSQTTSQASFRVDFVAGNGQPATCLFAGTHVPRGRLAYVTNGNFSCVVGNTQANQGTFTMTGLDAQRNGFHASFTGADQFCTYSGRFGGPREAGT
jgi:hypothetical protein